MAVTFSPKGQFYGPIMPKWMLKRKDTSLGAKMLYAALASCAYDGGDHCWPSQAWLADSLGISVRSVQNYVRELVELGLIATRAEKGSVLRYYFIKADMVELRSEKVYAASSEQRGEPSKVVSLAAPVAVPACGSAIPSRKLCRSSQALQPSPQVKTERQKALESAEQAFKQVWDIWPKKQAELPARQEWHRLWFCGKLPAFADLMAKIDQLKREDRYWHRGMVKNLVNWLREERWNDEPVPKDAGPGWEPGKAMPPSSAPEPSREIKLKEPLPPESGDADKRGPSIIDGFRSAWEGWRYEKGDMIPAMKLWSDLRASGVLPSTEAVLLRMRSLWSGPGSAYCATSGMFSDWLYENYAKPHEHLLHCGG